MKLVYMGAMSSPSFYVTKNEKKITGYSQTLEKGDYIVFNKDLSDGAYEVSELERRNYNGVFKDPSEAANAHFTAFVRKLSQDEVRDFKRNPENEVLFQGMRC